MYGAFTIPALGMKTQSYALSTIGTNMTNVNTGGYKRTETRFQTLLSRDIHNHTDMSGLTPADKQVISQAGTLTSSSSSMDVSIQGEGFFYLNDAIAGTGRDYYTRDGGLQIVTNGTDTTTGLNNQTITVSRGYLADKNGLFLMGWTPDANGTFNTSGAVSALRVDHSAFRNQSQATTQAELFTNLPAGNATNSTVSYTIDVYDSGGNRQSIDLQYTKRDNNVWDISFVGDTGDTYTVTPTSDFGYSTSSGITQAVFTPDATVPPVNGGTMQIQSVTGGTAVQDAFRDLEVGDTITVTNSTLNSGTYTISAISTDKSQLTFTTASAVAAAETDTDGVTVASTGVKPAQLVFDNKGALTAPTTAYTVNATFAEATTAAFTLDLRNATQYAGRFDTTMYNKNGYGTADLIDFTFDASGNVTGQFSDTSQRVLYKLAMATFANPDALLMTSGNTFQVTTESGAHTLREGGGDWGVFLPNTHELSNVNIQDEMSRLILAQNAYNSSATVFRTLDEMTQEAGRLKG